MMKLFNFYQGGEIKLGLNIDDVLYSAAGLDGTPAFDNLISGEIDISELKPGEKLPSGIRFAPPVLNPSKLVCAGLNFRDHAEETKSEIPEVPLLFSKLTDCLSAHGDEIRIPPAVSKIDYEAELVVVIGKFAYNISRDEAEACIFGYTCGNDFSARDAQLVSSQWFIGKSLPGFAPVGPYIVPKDELDVTDQPIICTVNGETVQSSSTANMIFTPPGIVAYASKYMYLKPGDLIFTGTPAGVILGKPKGARKWLQPGDEITVTIGGIGSLKNVLK